VSVFQAVAELEARNEGGVLCTIVRSQGSTPRHTASKMLVYPDGRIVGSVGGGELEIRVIAEAQQALEDGKARTVSYNMADPDRGDPGICGGQVEIYVEPIMPKPTLVVIGAGHVGKAVAHLAHWLGYYVVVSDDRAGLCTPEHIPEADAFYPIAMAELPSQIEINRWTAIVLTTRGSDVDVLGLPALLKTPAKYIGVIGSRRRWELTRKQLIDQGISPEQLAQVRSPIGLELNAETPAEIAVSIMAEVLMLRLGGHGRGISRPEQQDQESDPGSSG
jgi:xanthine dehydrogenase accessory factor